MVLVSDEAFAGVEVAAAAGITEDAERDEHRVGHGRKEMDTTSFQRKLGKIEFADVRRAHGVSVGILDENGRVGLALVDDGSIDACEVTGGAGIVDLKAGGGTKWRRGSTKSRRWWFWIR